MSENNIVPKKSIYGVALNLKKAVETAAHRLWTELSKDEVGDYTEKKWFKSSVRNN